MATKKRRTPEATKNSTRPSERQDPLVAMYEQCREVFDEDNPLTVGPAEKIDMARKLLFQLARRIEAGSPIEVKKLRPLCGWVLRACAFGYVPKAFTVKPRKTRPSEKDQLAKTGTNTSLRLACLVRLFELAGTPRAKAKRLIERVCGVSCSKIEHACGKWGIRSEDIPLLFDGAKGKELDQILGRAKQLSADKAHITQPEYIYCKNLLGRYLQLSR